MVFKWTIERFKGIVLVEILSTRVIPMGGVCVCVWGGGGGGG